MKSIRRRLCGYVFLFAASLSLTVWLGTAFMGKAFISETVFVFASLSLISLLLLVRQSRLLYNATLIRDYRIIAVPSALISVPKRQAKKDSEETIVSTFGILIGAKVYRWGLDGVHGVRLHSAQIDAERMRLFFGNAEKILYLELPHGLTKKEAVLDAAQSLYHETGIRAEITGW